MTRSMVAKLLHQPTVALKDAAGTPRASGWSRRSAPSSTCSRWPASTVRDRAAACSGWPPGAPRWPSGRPDRVAGLLRPHRGPTRPLVVVETAGDRRPTCPSRISAGRGSSSRRCRPPCSTARPTPPCTRPRTFRPRRSWPSPVWCWPRSPSGPIPVTSWSGGRLDRLPTGSVVATGSARRRAQLANLRPDLTFTGLRGNLATRLAAVGAGRVAAVVVAKAATDRLGLVSTGRPVVRGPRARVDAAPGGARARWPSSAGPTTPTTRAALALIDDPAVASPVRAERAFLAELGGGCTLPVGAHAVPAPGPTADVVTLTGMMASADGAVVIRHRRRPPTRRPGSVGGPVPARRCRWRDLANGHPFPAGRSPNAPSAEEP